MMERRIVNPWTWQDRAGFVQANEVRDASRVLYCAGVVSVDDEGMPVHEGAASPMTADPAPRRPTPTRREPRLDTAVPRRSSSTARTRRGSRASLIDTP
jgi:hypothetical protein